jgi:NTE family protein
LAVSTRNCRRWLLLLVAAAVAAGCAQAPVVPGQVKRPKVALVLGGGGARGFAHIGVLRELEAEKIPVDLIVGVSVGSLIGALYADNPDTFALEWKAFQIERKEIFDFRIVNFLDSLASGEALKTYIDKNIKSRVLEELKIPLYVVAVDVKTGRRFVFDRGPIRDALRASAAIPGVFPPVPFQDKLLVDGGVLGNLAPQVARDCGADIVIGVNLAKSGNYLTEPSPSALNVILESIEIMGEELVRLQRNNFDVLIEPQVGGVGITDFSAKRELIDAGRQAARQAMPRIKELVNSAAPPAKP